MVMGLGAFFLVAGLIGGGYKIVNMRRVIGSEVNNKRAQLEEIQRIRRAIRSLPVTRNAPGKTELMAQASRLCGEFNLKAIDIRGNEEAGKRETTVLVKLHFRNVPLDKIFRFIHAVEHKKKVNASVGNLSINRTISGKEVFNVKITLYTKKPAEKKKRRRRRRS